MIKMDGKKFSIKEERVIGYANESQQRYQFFRTCGSQVRTDRIKGHAHV